MCTPRYDVTLGRFMGVAHPLPRRRGNVATRQPHVRQRPAVDVPRGSPVEGPAGVLRQVGQSTGGSTAGPGTARWSACSRHGGRSGSSGRRSGCSPWTPRARRSTGTRPGRQKKGLPARRRLPRGGAEHGRTRFNRMKRYRKAATHYGRLDEAFLADLRLILVAIYLKNTAKNPTSVNTP